MRAFDRPSRVGVCLVLLLGCARQELDDVEAGADGGAPTDTGISSGRDRPSLDLAKPDDTTPVLPDVTVTPDDTPAPMDTPISPELDAGTPEDVPLPPPTDTGSPFDVTAPTDTATPTDTAAPRDTATPPTDAPAASCGSATTCSACTPLAGCGFCQDTGRCTAGSATGPTTGTCAHWAWVTSDCATVTGDPCTANTTCGTCTPVIGCGWCRSSRTCMSGSTTGPGMGRGTCASSDWQWLVTQCTAASTDSCGSSTGCTSCTVRSNCGWCRDSSTCHTGTSAGATDQACAGSNWRWSAALSCI